MYEDNFFDGPLHLEKNEAPRRKPKKKKWNENAERDVFSRKKNKTPYDKSKRRERIEW